MRKVLTFLLISLLMSFSAVADLTKTQVAELTSIGVVKSELEFFEKYMKTKEARENEIFEFKIKFSELVTNFATTGVYNNQFESGKSKLEKLESKVLTWKSENEQKINKTKELGIVLDQIYSSYQGLKKKSSKKQRAMLNKNVREVDELIVVLRDYQDELKEYDKFLDKFLVDTNRWKNFLLERIKSSLEAGIFRWNLNDVIHSPIDTIKDLGESVKNIIDNTIAFPYKEFFSENSLAIFLRFIVSGLISIFCLGVVEVMRSWYFAFKDSENQETFMRDVKTICDHPQALALCGLFFLVFASFGPFAYTMNPSAINFAIAFVAFTVVWIKLVSPILLTLTSTLNNMSANKTFNINLNLIYIFITLSAFAKMFAIDSDLINFVNAIILTIVCYQFFYLAFFIRFHEEERGENRFIFFLKAIKILFIIFTGTVLFSSILQLIGFHNLGRAIQSVVAFNVVLVTVFWVIYQVYCIILDDSLKRFPKNISNTHIHNLLKFLRKNGGHIFTIFVSFKLIESWYKAVYVFGDFWSSSIIKISNYSFTVQMLFESIVLYYFFRIFYILTLFIIFYVSSRTMSQPTRKVYAKTSNYSIIVKYTYMVLFVLMLAGILGFTFKNLLILASALGVGIGFGLQNIFNNFMSGIILLFERPIRVGDLIDVDGMMCTVKQIGMRSTVVETFDNSSIILPNSDILSSKLTNWTHNGNRIAVRIDVGVAYGTDTRLVTDILTGVAKGHPDVLTELGVYVWLKEFADSSLNFQVKVWIDKPEERASVKSEIMQRIYERFNECNIEIPFPQQDVLIKNLEKSEGKV